MDDSKACVLLLDLPNAAFCGIDLLSFTTNPRFQGIKAVPVGWHFIFTGVNSLFSLRHGRWIYVEQTGGNAPQLFILRWDASTETLKFVQDKETQLKLRANLGAIWREGLTPYRQTIPPDGQSVREETNDAEEGNGWAQLTDCITRQLLDRVVGSCDETRSCGVTSGSSAMMDADQIPGLTSEEATQHSESELHFLPIDLKRTWREGAVGRERTEAAQDRTWALKDLLRENCQDPMEIIGELQLVFIMVLTINNNSCLEQWRRILSLVLTCKIAAIEQPVFFCRFLQSLKLQLEHCSDAEGGLIDLSDEGATFLKMLLKRFRQGLDQQPGSQAKLDVMDEFDDLETYLREEHSWISSEHKILRDGKVQLEDGDEVEVAANGHDEEDEHGDFAPTIVDLTPELAEQLGLPRGSTGPEKNLQSMVSEEEQAANEYEEDDQDLESMDARY